MRIERILTKAGQHRPRLLVDDSPGVIGAKSDGCKLHLEAEDGQHYKVTIPPAEAAKIARMARHYGWEV